MFNDINVKTMQKLVNPPTAEEWFNNRINARFDARTISNEELEIVHKWGNCVVGHNSYFYPKYGCIIIITNGVEEIELPELSCATFKKIMPNAYMMAIAY